METRVKGPGVMRHCTLKNSHHFDSLDKFMNMFGSVDDSDQSISEEDLDVGYSGNCAVSLGSPSEIKGRSIRLLSQIETLDKAYCGLDGTTNPVCSLEERQPKLPIEDEIEFPLFNNKDNPVHSPRRPRMFGTADGFTCFNGLISTNDSNEDNVCQEQKASPCLRYPKSGRDGDAWSEASKEVEALAQCLKIRPSLTNGSISKPNKSFKAGGRGKLKAKFSFRSGSCKGEFFPAESGTNTGLYPADVLKSNVFNPTDPRAEFLEDGLKVEQPDESANSYQMASCDDHKDHSVAEFLDSLQGSNLLRGNSETHKWRGKRKLALKTNDILADDIEMDQDMLMDVWSLSSEEDDGPQGPKEEDNSLNRKSIFPCIMVDHFQDVFDAVSPKYHIPKAMFEGLSGNALFERLQHLILIKKEADMDFLKKSQMDFNLLEGSGCLNVKILSRSLEAKLTVCCCSLVVEGDEERIMTVIFNSRACDSFELEVANLVRVHHPWKEINIMGKDGAVILSTYFSKL